MTIRTSNKIVLLMISLSATWANAHNPYIEPQAVQSKPWMHRNLDSNFARPFKMVDNNVEQSQAIFGWLDSNDVDVVSFSVTSPVIVSASTLPIACNQNKHLYPMTGLVGPMTASAMFTQPPDDLPFKLPEGYGILIASNPEIPSTEERPVFHVGGGINTSWFLPEGLTEQCLLNDPLSCNYENTIAHYIKASGTYYIVTWDPKGQHQNYALNIGFSEDSTNPDKATETLIRDNEWMHTPCTNAYAAN